ncbi:MAG: hypothetical protein K0M45_11045 [Candidatus Paracaedibacteraceae bacterium]|nr:hypothetical protein [Candidatus Paracaedibacteraceae bacterium]
MRNIQFYISIFAALALYTKSPAMESTDSQLEERCDYRTSSLLNRENFPSTVPTVLEAHDIEVIINNQGTYRCRNEDYAVWGRSEQNPEKLRAMKDCSFLSNRSVSSLRAVKVLEQENMIPNYIFRYTETPEGPLLLREYLDLESAVINATFIKQALSRSLRCGEEIYQRPLLNSEKDSPIIQCLHKSFSKILVYRLCKENEYIEDFLFVSSGKSLTIDEVDCNALETALEANAKRALEEGSICSPEGGE